MSYNYQNLTGELLKIIQIPPYDQTVLSKNYPNISGNLRMNNEWDSCIFTGLKDNISFEFIELDGHAIFDNGIIFKELLDEISSYFTEWTITITIFSNSEGELWEEIPIVTFIENDNKEAYKIMTNNNLKDVDYESKNFTLYNYLYKGVSPNYNSKDSNNYITYRKFIDDNGVLQEKSYPGKIQIQQTFLSSEYPSGDIIIKSPQGSLCDTFLESLVISTTETYSGQAYNRNY